MAESPDPATPFPLWEYRVIHINVENNAPPEPPNPQVASQKLQGALSPEFIAREFPEQYGSPPPPQAKFPNLRTCTPFALPPASSDHRLKLFHHFFHPFPLASLPPAWY